MSELAPRINPEDVFPHRNLPGEAEQWGRVVEDRTRELEKNAVAVNQSLQGANRGTAAQLANTSEQLTAISDAQAALAGQQSTLADQQQTLSDQQTQLSDQQQTLLGTVSRLNETNQVYTRVLSVSSDDSDFFPAVLLNKPTWANAAFVTGSMIYETGSTTREALLVTTLGPDYPGPQISNYFVSSEFAVVQEASQPAVATDFLGNTLRIDTYRNVMTPGTGDLGIRQFINITWVYDSNISL